MLKGESRPPCSPMVRCQKVERPGSWSAWKETTATVIANAIVKGMRTFAYLRSHPSGPPSVAP